MPDELKVTFRMARTEDGLAPDAVLIERVDGRAITARDLRAVRFPRAWMLASSQKFLTPGDESSVITAARNGARGKGDEHWRDVFNLWTSAKRVAPHAHVRWMRTQWPVHVSDATMRRWIARARERADINGWRDDRP
jgi:hypothetical protein